LPLIIELRQAGIKTMGALGKGAIREQLSLSDKFGAPWTVLMGITEVRDGNAIIRNMKKGTQETVPVGKVVANLKKKIGEKNLDRYSPGELLY